MDNFPLVAVVIPAFNPGDFLAHTLDALIAQTERRWEAILVDDGSDESLEGYAASDPRVRFVRQSNGGLSSARNVGIGLTSAPLVAFLDSDDLWLPRKLELQIAEFVRRPQLAMLSTRFDTIDASGLVIGSGFEGHHDSYAALLQGNGVCVSTVMVRRSVLLQVGQFDLSLAAVQDWDLWLRIARHHEVDRVETSLVHYRLHAAGMSQNWRRTYVEGKDVIRRHFGVDALRGRRHVRRLAAFQAFDAARSALGARDRRTVAGALKFVALHRPSLLIQAGVLRAKSDLRRAGRR